jgi:transcriptional regulator with XRE-family HTH domain
MLRIKEIMKSRGVGATELASTLGVNRQTVYFYLKQGEKNPVSQLKKIAAALGVPVTELFAPPPGGGTVSCPHCGGKITVEKG